VFVGDVTLEIDLARLLPLAIAAGIGELPLGDQARAAQLAGLTAITAGTADAQTRREFLGRFSGVGKGRVAQRLAAHVERVDLAARAAELPQPADPHSSPDGASTAGRGPLQLLCAAPGGYLLAALDGVSRIVRGAPLGTTLQLAADVPVADVVQAAGP
jgi:putative ATP-dependent endonuclease of OLD family